MTINERDVAGIGIVNFTDQVDVAISIVDAGSIAATLLPSPETVPSVTYVVSTIVDGVPALLQGVSWTQAEIDARTAKTLTFDGLDLSNVSKVLVGVDIDPAVAVITEAALALAVGGTGPMAVMMDNALSGLSGYIMEATIMAPSIARFVDVTFPSSFALATHTPDPVSAPIVQLQAVDLGQVINPGDSSILLADLVIEGLAPGTTEVQLVVTQMDDDSGFAIRTIVRSAIVTVT